ncbi:sensor histidine kinase [Nocardioides alkalitolerans]|uniref:sensor histidine kinase n=1 Tax=Nocardioides alkalitolerans TaxID=281714 RepID=UPI00048B0D43|nr:ATP-binding protein [Nocardioides alkalitolerans]
MRASPSRTLDERLVSNLVRNAAEHQPGPGGTIWVTTIADDGAASLTIENTGDVVDPAVLDSLTEPFVRGRGRTRSAHAPSSSGLGLAIVASIARAHGAVLTLDAREDGGLVVQVRFPVAHQQRG